ncbi:hypothetical protein FNO25_001319 [Vibrio fluvialis]|uniref:hypothetical protein n=1 Tax=Vibrio fluvialis TaxID=676 RepID=UPI0014048591|nr:hypothetical protein [Vibrio fluvialis]EKO3973348.1 hypothetical protein [Vibrio fluvialis]NHN74009.1 hypothetical protein [Vibrio fluvialis]
MNHYLKEEDELLDRASNVKDTDLARVFESGMSEKDIMLKVLETQAHAKMVKARMTKSPSKETSHANAVARPLAM